MTFGVVINTFGGQLSPYTIDDVSVIIETPADPDCQRLQGLRRSSGTFVVLLPNSKVRAADDITLMDA